MKLVQIGFGNMVSSDRIIAVVGPEASPVKRLIQDARDRGTLIDATSGRKTRSVILMDSDHLILSSLTNEELTRELTREAHKE
ncbi:MAG: extracellular matrix/biofilm biosynthesis regulator RemA family protein [Saccharofermentanales bacterium]